MSIRHLAAFLEGLSDADWPTASTRSDIADYSARASALDEAFAAAADFQSTRFDDAMARVRQPIERLVGVAS